MFDIITILLAGQYLYILLRILSAKKRLEDKFKFLEFVHNNYFIFIINMILIFICGFVNTLFVFLPPIGIGLLICGSGIEAFVGKILKIVGK